MRSLVLFACVLAVRSVSFGAEMDVDFLSSVTQPDACSNVASCTQGGHAGVCTENTCCPGGTVTAGLCPGGNDIECCTLPSCTTPSGDGTCMSTAACSGTSVAGHCVGPSDIQCCVGGTPTPAPAPTPRPSGSMKGVDLAGTCSSSTLGCLVKAGFDFAIFRAWHSTGVLDTTACPNIKAARAQGMNSTGVYMFPCPKCSASAATQVANMISGLKTAGCSPGTGSSSFSRVWLDIEGTQYWSSSTATNQAFFNGLVAELKTLGVALGVYSSASQWDPIMGSSFSGGSAFPVWYAHYDNTPSFNDFKAFGGWSTPFMKQYNGDQTSCGFDVDWNWTPNAP